MPTLEANSEIRTWSHQAVADADPQHRADAIEQLRGVIRNEYSLARSAEDKLTLQIAAGIFDFIDETLNSRP